jgi:hypothetical protein
MYASRLSDLKIIRLEASGKKEAPTEEGKEEKQPNLS